EHAHEPGPEDRRRHAGDPQPGGGLPARRRDHRGGAAGALDDHRRRRRRRHPPARRAGPRHLDPPAHLGVPGDADLLPGGRLLQWSLLALRTAEGIGYAEWLRARLRRLGIPLIPLLLAWLVISVVAVAAGAEYTTVQLASQMALIPTWFLAAY